MREGCSDMSGMINRADVERFQEAMRSQKEILGFSEIVVDKNVAKITIVGVGLRSNLEIPATICKTLADESINIHMIYSSEMKMSVVINQQALQPALTSLHNVFNLDQQNIPTAKEAA
jgi:aspartate kinase